MRAGYSTKLIFKRNLTGLISENNFLVAISEPRSKSNLLLTPSWKETG